MGLRLLTGISISDKKDDVLELLPSEDQLDRIFNLYDSWCGRFPCPSVLHDAIEVLETAEDYRSQAMIIFEEANELFNDLQDVVEEAERVSEIEKLKDLESEAETFKNGVDKLHRDINELWFNAWWLVEDENETFEVLESYFQS